MKNWLQKPSVEIGLLLAALATGIVMRLALLNRPALGDVEAQLALNALSLARGGGVLNLPEPAYLQLTSVWFFLFSASEVTARLWPALAGCLLLLAPWLLRERIGRGTVITLTVLLAIEPAFVTAARTADGAGGAYSCLILAGVLLLRGSSGWAGFFAGLSLLGGPSVWPAAISLGLAAWLFRDQLSLKDAFASLDWRKFLVVGGATFIAVGSLGFTRPAGLSAAAGSLAEYLQGWVTPGTTSIENMLLAWLAYQFPTLIFAVIALVRGLKQKDGLVQALGVWWGIALILAVAYLDRSPLDLAWPALPMLGLAAWQLKQLLSAEAAEPLAVLGQAAISVALISYMVYTLAFSPGASVQPYPQSLALRGIVAGALLVAISAMVGWGWSPRTALLGLQWAVVPLLAFYGISAAWHATGNSRNPTNELIRPSAYVTTADLLVKQLKETTMWRPVTSVAPTIAVVGVPDPSLAWALRDYPQTVYSDFAALDAQSEVVISPRDAPPSLAADYRGQGLTWSLTPAWSLLSPGEWLHWLAYRDISADVLEARQLIFWVRSDQFAGGADLGSPVDEGAETE